MNTRRIDIIYPRLSYELMSALFEVHNSLGSTLLEKHYQRAFEQELTVRNIPYVREKFVDLVYKDKSIGKYFLDFVVDDKIVVEMKVSREFGQSAFKQAYSYLKQLGLPLAIVVNFHGQNLRYKRIVNPKYKGIQLEG
jgi:GxxExxY protein